MTATPTFLARPEVRSFAALGTRLGRMLDRSSFRLRLGRYWDEVGDLQRTRLSWLRFDQLARFARLVHRERIPGDYAEFGVWRGGSLFLVASLWRDLGADRDLLGFDSFAGLPQPDADRDGGELHAAQFGDTDHAEVQRFFAARGLDRIALVAGWFEHTIAQLGARRLALCHIDADLHASVKLALEAACARMSPGGIIVLDDYRHPHCSGATIAAEEFFATRPETIRQSPGIDYSAWVRIGAS